VAEESPRSPSLAQWWERWQHMARRGEYPFQYTPFEDDEHAVTRALPVFAQDPDAFTREFTARAGRYERLALEAQEQGDSRLAQQHWLSAYGLHRMARFPCMSSAGKQAAYVRSQHCILQAFSYERTPIRRVEMPFKGRAGEGDKVVGLLRVPPGVRRLPLLVAWAGIDTFKEDWLPKTVPFFERGIATLTVDMPGTGDAPLKGSVDAERMWDAVFDWIDSEQAFDAARVAGWGGSFGGYWATKLAHTHRERFAAVVSQGWGVHAAFDAGVIALAQSRGLPWGQAETAGHAFGCPGYADYVELAPRLSLLEQGVLDRPCAPLLCINGVKDHLVPVEDYWLLLQHGSPKAMRLFPGGHMGADAQGSQQQTLAPMLDWIGSRLLG
jgi:esterase FrsA